MSHRRGRRSPRTTSYILTADCDKKKKREMDRMTSPRLKTKVIGAGNFQRGVTFHVVSCRVLSGVNQSVVTEGSVLMSMHEIPPSSLAGSIKSENSMGLLKSPPSFGLK